MSSTEIQNRPSGNRRLASLRSTLSLVPSVSFFPVKCGCDGLGINELDRLRGLLLARTSDETERGGKTQTKSPGYVRNYAAAEMGRTAVYEKIMVAILAVGGVASIWLGTTGINDLLARWSGFVDLVGNVLR